MRVSFLPAHEVHTVVEMGWPDQLENGKLLEVAEQSGFDVMVTSDQNIRYQQNLAGAWLEHLACGAKTRRGDNRKRRCCQAWKLCVYRNAAPAEISENDRALSNDDDMPRARPQFVHPL